MWMLMLAGLIAMQAQQPRTTLTPDLKRAEQHDKNGWAKLEARDFKGAADAFEAAVQIHPLYADALYGLGKARMALQVPPFVSLALGSAYFHLERLPDAERLFREALAIEPKFGEALSNLALVCLLTGRAPEAQSYVKIAEEARFSINPELKRRIREALQKQ